ncbi:hypothetical protein FBZ81_103511 [Azospirillum brasilense]|nr:hypothetical protein OH82_00177 [Azospirillum brasilense]TWB85243.1 hypothetical protein FBZ81_103511 [Azospirillum brasilense]
MQRQDQLSFAMRVHRHFRLMIHEVELPRDGRPIREIGVEGRDG